MATREPAPGRGRPDPYAELAQASFFADEGATQARIAEEAKRKRTPAERQQAKKRAPASRTEFIGFRTTPDIKALVEMLRKTLGDGKSASATEVLEQAVQALANHHGVGGQK